MLLAGLALRVHTFWAQENYTLCTGCVRSPSKHARTGTDSNTTTALSLTHWGGAGCDTSRVLCNEGRGAGTDSNTTTVLSLTHWGCAGRDTSRVLRNEGRGSEAQAGRLGPGALGDEEGPRDQGTGDSPGTRGCYQSQGEHVRVRLGLGGSPLTDIKRYKRAWTSRRRFCFPAALCPEIQKLCKNMWLHWVLVSLQGGLSSLHRRELHVHV